MATHVQGDDAKRRHYRWKKPFPDMRAFAEPMDQHAGRAVDAPFLRPQAQSIAEWNLNDPRRGAGALWCCGTRLFERHRPALQLNATGAVKLGGPAWRRPTCS